MRIHPLQSKKRRPAWQLIAVGLVASTILSIGIQAFSRPKAELVQIPRKEVVIAKKSVEAGTPLEKAELALEFISTDALPSDPLTSLAAIKGKVAAGPISAGSIVSQKLLAEPVAIIATNTGTGFPVEDPIDTFLHELAKEPGIMKAPLEFSMAPPRKGSRVVITLKYGNRSAVLAEEAWIGDQLEGRGVVANVYMKRERFPIVSKIDNRFELKYFVLDGQSARDPSIKELKDEAEFNSVFGFGAPANVSLGVQQSKSRDDSEKMHGYAWLPDRKLRLGLRADGTIVMVNPDGKGDVPLRELGQ